MADIDLNILACLHGLLQSNAEIVLHIGLNNVAKELDIKSSTTITFCHSGIYITSVRPSIEQSELGQQLLERGMFLIDKWRNHLDFRCRTHDTEVHVGLSARIIGNTVAAVIVSQTDGSGEVFGYFNIRLMENADIGLWSMERTRHPQSHVYTDTS